MVKPHSCSASVRLGLRVWMRCSQGRIFSTLATDTVSTKMMCSPGARTASPGCGWRGWCRAPRAGPRQENRSRGEPGRGELLDDPHVVDGAAHLAAAIVQAEIAGGRLTVQYQHLAHIDPARWLTSSR